MGIHNSDIQAHISVLRDIWWSIELRTLKKHYNTAYTYMVIRQHIHTWVYTYLGIHTKCGNSSKWQ